MESLHELQNGVEDLQVYNTSITKGNETLKKKEVACIGHWYINEQGRRTTELGYKQSETFFILIICMLVNRRENMY